MSRLAGFEWLPATVGSGSYSGSSPAIGIVHTTEGSSIAGAVGAYQGHGSWPQFTVDPRPDVRRRVQHYDSSSPGRALRNLSGGVQTNLRGRRVVQVEVVGFAASMRDQPAAVLDWLGAMVVGPISRAEGIALSTSVTFYDQRSGFTLATTTARQRLSQGAWLSLTGWAGHQHVPENTHWDPGAIDMNRVLRAAGGQTDPSPVLTLPPEDEDMTTQLWSVKGQPGRAALITHGPAGCFGQQVHGRTVQAKRFLTVRVGGFDLVEVPANQFDSMKRQCVATGGWVDLNGKVTQGTADLEELQA